MKLVVLLTLVATFNASSGVIGKNITLSKKNASLENIFSMIKKQTGYVFFYDYSIFQNARKVTLDLKDADIEDVMQVCMRGQDLAFSILDKTITIVQKEEKIEAFDLWDNINELFRVIAKGCELEAEC